MAPEIPWAPKRPIPSFGGEPKGSQHFCGCHMKHAPEYCTTTCVVFDVISAQDYSAFVHHLGELNFSVANVRFVDDLFLLRTFDVLHALVVFVTGSTLCPPQFVLQEFSWHCYMAQEYVPNYQDAISEILDLDCAPSRELQRFSSLAHLSSS